MTPSVRVNPQQQANRRVPIFRVRLRNGASIGPTTLKQLWSLAAMSDDVSVSRDGWRPGHASIHYAYVVSGPARLADLNLIESNLRRLLQERLSAAHVELMRLI